MGIVCNCSELTRKMPIITTCNISNAKKKQPTNNPPPPRNVNTEITKKGMYEHSPLTEEKTVVLQLVYNEMVLRFKEKKKDWKANKINLGPTKIHIVGTSDTRY